MRKILITMITLSVGILSMGAPLRIDVEEAIRLAYENSYILKNADIDHINSNLQIREAYKEALPKIDYSGGAERSGAQMYGDNNDNKTNYDHKVELIQPVYRGGAIGSGISAAKNMDKRSQLEYENVKNDLRLQVIEKYITILQLYESKEVFERSLKEVQEQYSRVNRQYELKLIAKSEVLPFKTRVINTRTSIIETDNKIKIAEVELKNELGIERTVEIDLSPISSMSYDLSLIDLESDVDYARNNNKDARIADLNTEIAEANRKAARSVFLPRADFRFGYGSDSSRFNSSADDWQWTTGVTVSMNLFSFGQDLNAYERAKNSKTKSLNTEKKVQDDIEVEVRSYYLDLIRLVGTIQEQIAAVASARENLNLERRRYDSGLTTVIDFLQIENVFREAQLSLIEAELDYYLAYEKYIDSLK